MQEAVAGCTKLSRSLCCEMRDFGPDLPTGSLIVLSQIRGLIVDGRFKNTEWT